MAAPVANGDVGKLGIVGDSVLVVTARALIGGTEGIGIKAFVRSRSERAAIYPRASALTVGGPRSTRCR
jgi:hypothetical protein